MTSTVDADQVTRLVHTYQPRGAALEVLRFRDAEVILSGPAGTGKSRACLEKMHLVALRNKDFRGLMVRKTMKSLTESGLVTFQRYVAGESILAGHVKWYGGSMRAAAAWQYAKGAEILCGGMDKPSKIMSTEYDIVYVQEATDLTRDDWEAILSRLRNGGLTYAQIIADCNPSTPFHWIKKRAEDGMLTMLESRHEDNPLYFEENRQMTKAGRDYIVGKLERLSGPRLQRMRYGKWVAAEGQIYEEWDDAVHLVVRKDVAPGYKGKRDRYGIPMEWPRYWAIDFGYTNPFVCQRWAEDPDGRLWMYAETYHTQRLVEDHARAILREVTKTTRVNTDEENLDPVKALAAGARAWREPIPQAVICDHDAEGRATWEKHSGLATTAAMKDKEPGIQAVQARLRVAGDGKPRLFMLRDARTERDQGLVDAAKPTCTVEEWAGYVRRKPPQSGQLAGVPLEEPLDVDNHGMDASRYLVVHRDGGAGYELRVLTLDGRSL